MLRVGFARDAGVGAVDAAEMSGRLHSHAHRDVDACMVKRCVSRELAVVNGRITWSVEEVFDCWKSAASRKQRQRSNSFTSLSTTSYLEHTGLSSICSSPWLLLLLLHR